MSKRTLRTKRLKRTKQLKRTKRKYTRKYTFKKKSHRKIRKNMKRRKTMRRRNYRKTMEGGVSRRQCIINCFKNRSELDEGMVQPSQTRPVSERAILNYLNESPTLSGTTQGNRPFTLSGYHTDVLGRKYPVIDLN